jgi:hypothetical protein
MTHHNSNLVREPREIIASFIRRDDVTGCWNWTGAKVSKVSGYGYLTFRQRNYAAHRFAYEHLVGPIPTGAWILHHCDNRGCINPAHLYVGTPKDNAHDRVMRSPRPPKHTACKWGHEYVEGSYRITRTGSRVCKICMREYMREWVREDYRRKHPNARTLPRTHCPQGHPYSGANLMIVRRSNGRISRVCRTCKQLKRKPA